MNAEVLVNSNKHACINRQQPQSFENGCHPCRVSRLCQCLIFPHISVLQLRYLCNTTEVNTVDTYANSSYLCTVFPFIDQCINVVVLYTIYACRILANNSLFFNNSIRLIKLKQLHFVQMKVI